MKIGFVGLGQMGRVMVPLLFRDDWRITGLDISRPDSLPSALVFTTRLADTGTNDLIVPTSPDGRVATRGVGKLVDAGWQAPFTRL